jgi:hypothetical protein
MSFAIYEVLSLRKTIVKGTEQYKYLYICSVDLICESFKRTLQTYNLVFCEVIYM